WVSGMSNGAFAVLLFGFACGCSERTGTGAETSRALSAALSSSRANAAFGFESLTDWTISSGAPSLIATPKTEGQTALRLQGPTRYTTVTSAAFPLSASDLGPLGSGAITFDLVLPQQQPNPFWYGDLQLFVGCPSRGLIGAPVGQVMLTGKPLGAFFRPAFDT